ncbi:hypothetical protein B0O80DRAFT_493982 [Mortierella sp. GBAus27b]|nr:hypothetical protein BGX31_011627 [Mortierella sp. GBA43]KAI8361422.1 hypothetical protein B0O80DRAFT_493982 [Mortierella sp. GBAus27b]
MDSQSNPARPSFNQSMNMSEFVQINHKVFFAAADRNKEVILDQLRPFLDKAERVLEVGSGSGQHIYRFSKDYPNVVFQPTEYDLALLSSIDTYAEDLNKEGHHINSALELDATKPEHWEQVGEPSMYDLVVTSNVFHISPWIVGRSIVCGAGQMLKSGGSLAIYGPFKRNGTFNTDSNREFDQTLRGRDPSWGVRDVEEIEAVAKNEAGMKLDRIVDMPSNNYMLFFEKL